jgi:hypothetical protein
VSTHYDPEQLLAQVRAALAPDSPLLEARMDRAANVDSEVVRYLRHLLARRPGPAIAVNPFEAGFRAGLEHARAEHRANQDPDIAQLAADQRAGDERRGDAH